MDQRDTSIEISMYQKPPTDLATLEISKRDYFRYVDAFISLPFLLTPFFLNLPYRVNIFLSWEGAYRLSIGQIPYRDFGLPMGPGYWLIPAIFFKVFGPTFLSLIKAQFLINLIAILSLRGIFYSLKVKPVVTSLGILVFCLTYVIYNFWPWYNHSVVVFELVAIYFLTRVFYVTRLWIKNVFLFSSAFFTAFAIFTKQDVGAICFVICVFLLAYEAYLSRDKKPIALYLMSLTGIIVVSVLPFVKSGFFYWFNYGQLPHSSRIDFPLLVNSLLGESEVEKLYLAGILIGILCTFSFRKFIIDGRLFVLSAISVAMIMQAIVTRVTSPLPTGHMSYYHVFGFVMLISFLPWHRWSHELKVALLLSVCTLIVYSAGYWKYASSVFHPKHSEKEMGEAKSEKWVLSKYKTLENISIPEGTLNGIDNLLKLPIVKRRDLKVLNMSELVFLAKELNYVPLVNHPLWFHVNIGMFQKQIDEINEKVRSRYYDVVLFENIPSLTEFYPSSVRDQLLLYYKVYDKFPAPRKLEDSSIEVFINDEANRDHELNQHPG